MNLRLLAPSICMLAMTAACPARTITVKLIAFNDFHGNLQSPGSFAQNAASGAKRVPVGGADALAAAIARSRNQNRLNVVVGGGDLVGASPLISALFHDEPTIEVLNHIGVDFSAVGNHEFDKGSAELRRLQNGGCQRKNGSVDADSCKGLGSVAPGHFDGAKFQYLAANVRVDATGRTLFPAYGVKTFDGVKIAFIGMTLKGTPGIVTPSGVAGLRFQDEADTVNALVPELHAQGIEAIVVLVHQGGAQPAASANDINGCDAGLKTADGSASAIGEIVSRLDDAVGLVISAHTHAAYNCSANTIDARPVDGAVIATPRPGGLPNSKGRLVPVTSASAFGRVLTDVDLTLDADSGSIVKVSAANRLVERGAGIPVDADVSRIVEGYGALVAGLANRVIGRIAAPVTSAAGANGESRAGDLIADAQLRATQPASLGGAAIALTNPGGIRGAGFAQPAYPMDVSYGNAFTTQPFGNSLVTMTFTAQQLKDVLEQQFAGCHGQTANRILQVSNGFAYSWSESAPPCSKIVSMQFTPIDLGVVPPAPMAEPEVIMSKGVVRHPDKRYRITVNNFLASGGDGFSLLGEGAQPMGGAQDIDALDAYLSGYAKPHAAYDPAAPQLGVPRITQQP